MENLKCLCPQYLVEGVLAFRRLSWSPVELASRTAKSLSGVINFASGSPDPSLVPVREMVEIFAEVASEYGAQAFTYPGAGGLVELVRELRGYSERVLGITVGGQGELAVVSGAQHGIKLLSQLLIGPGDLVFTEDPSFWEAVDPIRFQGAVIRGVAVDRDGLDTWALEDRLRRGYRPRLVYVIPTCHNPCGYIMSPERRKHLLELAESYGFQIIEDDPYRPIAENPPQSLKNMDRSGSVIYVSSMSKVLAPGLRIGFVILSREIAEELSKLEQHDFSTATPIQLLVARALRRGLVDSLLPRLRRIYYEKIKILRESLEKHFPGSYTDIRCGFFTTLRIGTDSDRHLAKAIESGVIYVPAREFYIEEKPNDAARISISTVKPEEIEEGVIRLKKSLRPA